jgi:hypothetical protein
LGGFRDSEVVDNAASQSDCHAIITGEVQWRNIAGSYVSNMKSLLMTPGATGGLWCDRKYMVEFEVKNFLGAPLIIGDWFNLDHDSVDPHQYIYGASWDGYNFLIYGLTMKQNSTLVKGIMLY